MVKSVPKNREDTRRIVSRDNLFSFLLGCLVCSTLLLNTHIALVHNPQEATNQVNILKGDNDNEPSVGLQIVDNTKEPLRIVDRQTTANDTSAHVQEQIQQINSVDNGQRLPMAAQQPSSILNGVRIIVAIASFNFAQLPHLEEVLDSYQDLCVTGAIVHIFIFTTVPYPVALIDLFNTRLECQNLEANIIVKSPNVRLNLVDFHRDLFYKKIEEYDLFIYSEDDIRVTPKTVAAYLEHTNRVEQIVGKSHAEDFNVGIVRYEYNYPLATVIDDKTRHATENVTRVYWEHLSTPIVPKAVVAVPNKLLEKKYVHMTNHHQGMYLATRDLLKAWMKRPRCQFNKIRKRPSRKGAEHQPTEGTQRVWMSSHMLYGSKHCNVQQVIPLEQFGQLNVLHLPNKNYRRVGKKGRLGGSGSNIENHFSDGSEIFNAPSSLLVTSMQLHLAVRKAYPVTEKQTYDGIKMINEWRSHDHMLVKRMKAYEDYVARGGVMSFSDISNWNWVEKK